MASIKNEWVSLSVNGRGQIDALAMAGGKNVIARPVGLFRAVLHSGDNWEAVAFADEQALTVSQAEDAIVLRADSLRTADGELPIGVTLTLRLDGEHVVFESTVDNRSEATLDDWIYPCLGAIDTLNGGRPDLLYPRHMGERIVDVCGYLAGLNGREALHEVTASYPGPLSMQWMLLDEGDTCLYFTGRDTLFHTSALRARGDEGGGVTMEMNKLAFVRPGETWTCPPYMAWLYQGDWMRGASEYAAWAATWRKPVRQKEWIRRMNGYFLVINKQQYGDEVWTYETIPKLYDYAQAHGFDALGLFGWYHSGHDNRYPDLEVSPTMGGADGLRAGIEKVHEKGGHVTLYYQGHLMDVGTKYYKEKGHLLEGKTRWGTPYFEFYDKFCQSDYLHFFSKKPFATICPSCGEWHELMARRADWIAGFGADGILYDQIGGMPPYPCFDESHGHLQNRPSLSHAQGRIRLHQRIRKQVDSHGEFAYMTEHVTDVHSQFLDCLHGIGSYPGAKGSGAATTGIGCHSVLTSSTAGAGPMMMPEMFRYTFPETMITIRNPNPTVSRRYANYALLYGFKLEMELRYRTDRAFIEQDEDAQAREYVAKIAAMRRRHEDYLILGRYMAQEGLENGNPAVKAAVFAREDGKRAVALWNDTDEAQPVSVALAGQALTAYASTEGDGEGIPQTIAPEDVLLLVEA